MTSYFPNPYLAPLSRLLCHRGNILFCTKQRPHKRSNGHSAHHINRNTRLLDRLQHAHMRCTPGTTSAQHQTHRVARQPTGQPREIGMYIRLTHQHFAVQVVLQSQRPWRVNKQNDQLISIKLNNSGFTTPLSPHRHRMIHPVSTALWTPSPDARHCSVF